MKKLSTSLAFAAALWASEIEAKELTKWQQAAVSAAINILLINDEEPTIELPSQNDYVVLSEDAANEANEDPKNILAGSNDDRCVYSFDLQGRQGWIEAGTVIITIKWATEQQLRNSINKAHLTIDGVFVDDAPTSNIRWNQIFFEDMNNFIVGDKNTEIALELGGSSIGFQRVWETLTNLKVSDVAIKDIKSFISQEDLPDVWLNNIETAEEFSIVPALVVPEVLATLNSSSQWQIRVWLNTWANTNINNNSNPNAVIEELRFSTLWSTQITQFKLVNRFDSTISIIADIDENNMVTFNFDAFDSLPHNQWLLAEWFFSFWNIEPVLDGNSDGAIASVKLLKDGITYSVPWLPNSDNLQSQLRWDLDLWSRTY